jgi:hypothetical protein
MNAKTCCRIAVIFIAATMPVLADPPSSADSQPSLDEMLLEDLDNQLLEGLDDIPGPQADAAEESKGGEDGDAGLADFQSELDRMLLEQLGEGEDLGQESSDPLSSIARRMRTVEQLISRQNTSERTQQIQEQIVADMEALIEQLQKKCSGGQCNNDGPKQPGKPSSGNKAGSGENQGSNQPAKDSTDRVGKSEEELADLERLERMLKSVWGHLPPKVREQMQNGTQEEFLPQYQELIEEYYKRLATESSFANP